MIVKSRLKPHFLTIILDTSLILECCQQHVAPSKEQNSNLRRRKRQVKIWRESTEIKTPKSTHENVQRTLAAGNPRKRGTQGDTTAYTQCPGCQDISCWRCRTKDPVPKTQNSAHFDLRPVAKEAEAPNRRLKGVQCTPMTLGIIQQDSQDSRTSGLQDSSCCVCVSQCVWTRTRARTEKEIIG